MSEAHNEVGRQGTPAKSIEAMDRAGIQTAFLSMTTPGVWFGDNFNVERQTAIALAREVNEYAARMVSATTVALVSSRCCRCLMSMPA